MEISSKFESQLVVQAARINTLSKLTFGDSKRFDGLLQDIFPGVELRDIEYESLRQALHEIFKEHHLLINDMQVRTNDCLGRESSVRVDSQSFGTLRTASTTHGCGHCRSFGLGQVSAVEDVATCHAEDRTHRSNLRDESKIHAENSATWTHRYRYTRMVRWNLDSSITSSSQRTSR